MPRLIHKFNSLDSFSRNIILVFSGTTLASFFNLLYQLLIAHRFSSADFASFNSLLSIMVLVSAPMSTVQTAITKYISEFNAHGHDTKTREMLAGFFGKGLVFSLFIAGIFILFSSYLSDKLKINSPASMYILAAIIGSACIIPVVSGGLQGLELFGWLMSGSVIPGLIKLGLAFALVLAGFNIAGALGALLAGNILTIAISIFPLRANIIGGSVEKTIKYKGFFLYLLPVALSSFCFAALTNFDMLLVKYFFLPPEAGLYALAQMIGKIFLFLPMAIGVVMFPRTSSLSAKSMDTLHVLRKSIFYAAILCLVAALAYNIFPAVILKIMTGKAYPESILLGRLFSVSMTLFTLISILTGYFLSIKDYRFIKYLVFFSCLQVAAIAIVHANLLQVQFILCLNSIVLFFIHLFLAHRK